MANPFDETLLRWVNGQAGSLGVFDDLAKVLASDYLMPLIFSASMFAMWFIGRTPSERMRHQLAALTGMAGVGIANIFVAAINRTWDRPRPFEELGDGMNLIFYRSTDPSFPANPMAVVFAVAAAVMLVDRRSGVMLAVLATVYSLMRVYVGTFYPTDAIGGALVGIAALLVARLLFAIFNPIPQLTIRILRGFGVA